MPETSDRTFRTSDGVQLHYIVAGQGPLMVLVPGWTMPAFIWEPQIRYFSKDHRVVALDPRSQGDSEQTFSGQEPHRRARDIQDLLVHLGMGPAVLVGWSMGAQEVLTLVQEQGTQGISAVVVVDQGLRLATDPNKEENAWPSFYKQIISDPHGSAVKFVRAMFLRPPTEAMLDRLVAAVDKMPAKVRVELLRHQPLDLTPALARLDRPSLFILTTRYKGLKKKLGKALPSATVEIFEGAGHALFLEEPERFNRLVGEFIERHH